MSGSVVRRFPILILAVCFLVLTFAACSSEDRDIITARWKFYEYRESRLIMMNEDSYNMTGREVPTFECKTDGTFKLVIDGNIRSGKWKRLSTEKTEYELELSNGKKLKGEIKGGVLTITGSADFESISFAR